MIYMYYLFAWYSYDFHTIFIWKGNRMKIMRVSFPCVGFEIYWYLIFIFWLLPTSDIPEFKIHWYRVWDFWFLQTSDTSISGFHIYWYLVYAFKIYFHLLYTCYLLQTSDISGFVAMSPDGGRIEWDSRQLSRTTGTRRRLVVS